MHPIDSVVKTPADYRAINRATIRIDGRDKVTGAAIYAADVPVQGVLTGKVLRSPLPYARIVRIDASAARALPGVHAVLTGADLPPVNQGRSIHDVPVLARDVVRFAGDKVAAVAADTDAIAQAALDAIEVEYEALTPLTTPAAALAADAPVLHPDWERYPRAHDMPRSHPNEAATVSMGKGDVDAAFAAAAHVFEFACETPVVHHVYLEPHSCVVAVDAGSGTASVRVWSTSKNMFDLQRQIAEATGRPAGDIEVANVYVGGDFGGKGAIFDEVIAYHLATVAGRPVRIVMEWVEEFQAAAPRHAAELRIKTGVDDRGRIIAREGWVTFDTGAYAGYKPWDKLLLPGFMEMLGPYRIPNSRVTARSVYTNNVPCGHMRAPGSVQCGLAGEHQIDQVAAALGLDPVAFRIEHLVQEGDVSPLGETWQSVTITDLFDIARQRIAAWSDPPDDGRLRGIGLACCDRHIGGGMSESRVDLEAGGRIAVTTATPDTGTGAWTMLQQVVAEDWGIALGDVRVVREDTSGGLLDDGSGASRVTHVVGRAAMAAGAEVREQLAVLAAEEFEAPLEAVAYERGEFFALEAPQRRIGLAALARIATERGIILRAEAQYRKGGFGGIPEQAWAVHAARVAIDPATGAIAVERYLAIHDVGTTINPQLASGQVEGGVVQGLGQALSEELVREGGIVTTTSHADYKVPCLHDTPALEVVLYEGSTSPGPFNAKSVAEVCLQPVPAVIANAVFQATGQPIRRLPITSDRLLASLTD